MDDQTQFDPTIHGNRPTVVVPPPAPPAKKRWWKRWWGVLILVLLVLILAFAAYVGYLVYQQLHPPPQASAENTNHFTVSSDAAAPFSIDKTRLVRNTSPSLGSPNAKVQIVEFADFECPYCQESYSVIRSLAATYGDRIYYVFRYYPVLELHEHAEAAAEAAACAEQQGKFWAYHDRLFQNQDHLEAADLRTYASTVGLDLTAYDQCVSGGQVKATVGQDVSDATALGVRGTPTWFINGYKVEGAIPQTTFKQIIDTLLKQ